MVVNVLNEGDSLERAAQTLTENIKQLQETMQEAANLRDELADLMKIQADLKRNQRMQQRILVAIGIIIILVVGLSVTQVYSLAKLNSVVTVQHDSALCPLYKLFINSDTPQAAAAAEKRGDDMAERAKAFATIRISYAALKCEG